MSVVYVFFNTIETRGSCATVEAIRFYDVLTTVPYPVKVYEYDNKGNEIFKVVTQSSLSLL